MITESLMLAQAQGDAAAGIAVFGFMCCFSVFGLAMLGFWIWMLVDCCTRTFPEENDKLIWILVVVLASWIGALIYFFVGRPKGTKM